MSDILFDKIRGGFYGQALGDAWAMPAWLNPQQTWDYYHGYITEFLDAPETHPVHHGLRAGQVTDDTEQAYAIAETIIADGCVSARGVADAMVRWYDRIGGDDSPYVGPSSRRAIQAIKRGADLNETGRMGDTNGASMRISPVGLIHPGDVEGAVRDTYQACIPSHNTDVAVSGASAVAGAIAAALVEHSTLDEVIAAGQIAADLGRKHGHTWIGASVSRRIDLAVQIARSGQSERQRLQDLYDLVGATLAISEAVPAAFGVLVMANGDPIQSAIYAAALSGDADTVAAMACAMAGAWKGAASFPPAVIAKIQQANPMMDFEMIIQGLYKLASQAATPA